MNHEDEKCETYGKKILNNIHRNKDKERECTESAGMQKELRKKREERNYQRGRRETGEYSINDQGNGYFEGHRYHCGVINGDEN